MCGAGYGVLSDKYPHAVASFTAGSILVLAVCYLGAWGRRGGCVICSAGLPRGVAGALYAALCCVQWYDCAVY